MRKRCYAVKIQDKSALIFCGAEREAWYEKYDYLIVGAGLYGAVMAYELGKKGKSCLMIDKRDHIAGNIYCEDVEGIHVHKYGAHIFHTSDEKNMGLYKSICGV